jgi:eukaryotic-like serine/threonine-protein kinase
MPHGGILTSVGYNRSIPYDVKELRYLRKLYNFGKISLWNKVEDLMADLTGRLLGSRYRVETFIGRGGMADVYQVWDEQRAVYLALKVLHAELAEDAVFLRRFEREAQTLDQLQHPNIVRFYGLEQSDGVAYFLMDYIEGLSLRKEILLNKDGLPPARILELMRPVCSALHYAHQVGLVHCDMKPHNIMLQSTGAVFLTDFGIARGSEGRSSEEGFGGFPAAGTPVYMAPEQLLGHPISKAADIYALGVTLFEMLTGGQRPFTGETAQISGSTTARITWEITHLPPPSPRLYNPEISEEMEVVVLRCLQLEAEDRFATALDLLLALEAAVLGVAEANETPTLFDAPQSESELAGPRKAALFKPGWSLRRFWKAAFHHGNGPLLNLKAYNLLFVGALVLAVGFAAISYSRTGSGLPPANETPAATSVQPSIGAGLTPSPPGEVESLSREPGSSVIRSPAREPTPIAPQPQPTPLGGSRWIAFASDRGGAPQVWIMDAQGENRRQITDEERGACDPAWSPDGRFIAFVTPCPGIRNAYPGAKIGIAEVGNGRKTILNLPEGGYDPAWSPDGKHLIYTSVIESRTGLYSYRMADGIITPLATQSVLNAQAAWALDGEQLAFIRDAGDVNALWLVRPDGTSQEVFSPASNRLSYSLPNWSPDGEWILATVRDISSGLPRLVLFQRNAPHLGEEALLPVDAPQTHGSFSPDGLWVVFEAWPEGGNHDIYIANLASKQMMPLSPHPAQDFQPVWGPAP